MTEDASLQGLPTTMGFAAKNAIDALRRRNVATAPVLRAAALSERDLAASDPLHHRVSAAGQSRLLDCAAEAIEDTATSARSGRRSRMRATPTCRNSLASLVARRVRASRGRGGRSDLLEFSNAGVAAPLLTADRKLLKALEPFCDMAAKERRTASDTLRAAVEKEVEKLLPHGKAQKRSVAKRSA